MKVIYASDTNPIYTFCLPLTTIIWKKFIDFSPICFLTGDKELWQSDINKLVLEKTLEAGAEIHFIGSVEGVRDGTLAQVSRLYGGCLDLDDEQYIITSDADMWPLNKAWFNQGDKSKAMQLFYANAYQHERYAICYIATKSKHWREIMDVNKNDSINKSLEKQIHGELGKDASFMHSWNYDENLFVKKVKEWNQYPHNCHMIDRGPTNDGPPVGRIDRYNWSFNGLNNCHIDAHLLRMPYLDNNWYKTYPVFGAILDKDLEWAMDYRKKFLSMAPGEEEGNRFLKQIG